MAWPFILRIIMRGGAFPFLSARPQDVSTVLPGFRRPARAPKIPAARWRHLLQENEKDGFKKEQRSVSEIY